MIYPKKPLQDEGETRGMVQFIIQEQLTLPSGKMAELKSFDRINNEDRKAEKLCSDDLKAVLSVPLPNPNRPGLSDYDRGYTKGVEDVASLIARQIECSVSTKKINGAIYLSRNHGPYSPPPPAAEPKPILEIKIEVGARRIVLPMSGGKTWYRRVLINGKPHRHFIRLEDAAGNVTGWADRRKSGIFGSFEEMQNGNL
jgi:hypothetical protein